MKNPVSLDVLSCLNNIYSRMKDNYSFAFPDHNLELGRGHQVLLRFGCFTYCVRTMLSADYIIPNTPLDDIFFKQVVANSKVIVSDKEFAYPKKTLEPTRISSCLHSIESSIKNYNTSLTILGNHCLTDKTVEFDLIEYVTNFSILSSYQYIYPQPENTYLRDNAHAGIQMLLAQTEGISFTLKSVKTTDSELASILQTGISQLKTCTESLMVSYPKSNFNQDLGHSCLNKFMDTWKNFKTTFILSLKNHFEKQNLIKDYEEKLKTHTSEDFMNAPEDEDLNSTHEVSLPVVKKIKSLL